MSLFRLPFKDTFLKLPLWVAIVSYLLSYRFVDTFQRNHLKLFLKVTCLSYLLNWLKLPFQDTFLTYLLVPLFKLHLQTSLLRLPLKVTLLSHNHKLPFENTCYSPFSSYFLKVIFPSYMVTLPCNVYIFKLPF